MPKSLVAHQSSTHRLACSLSHSAFPSSYLHDRLGLSLYRALLKQSFTLSATQSGGLRSLIRHRFKTDRLLQSPSQIANGLNAGDEVLKLLCASTQGETSATTRLSSLIESTLNFSASNESYRKALRSVKAPASPRLASRVNHLRLGADKQSQSRRPDSRPILERPLGLPEIKGGKRRVPKFTAVQGVPFLLYSKPQPLSLGRLLRQKIAWQLKKWDQRTKLTEGTIPLGESEDGWDSLVALQAKQEGLPTEKFTPEHGAHDLDPDPISWTSSSRFAEARIGEEINSFDRRNLETGRRLVEILKQERVLAAKEEAESECRKYEGRVLRRANEVLAAAPASQGPRQDERIEQERTG